MIESLEQRRLMSAVTAALDPNTHVLVVTAPNTGSTFQVQERSPVGGVPTHIVDVIDNTSGVSATTTFQNVSSVVINGGGAADNIQFTGYSIAASINGGSGDDSILVNDFQAAYNPSAFSVAHGGNGNDFLQVTAGNNTQLYGDNNDDTMVGPSSGVATVFAGNGSDHVYTYLSFTVGQFAQAGTLPTGTGFLYINGGNSNGDVATIFVNNTSQGATDVAGTSSANGTYDIVSGIETVTFNVFNG